MTSAYEKNTDRDHHYTRQAESFFYKEADLLDWWELDDWLEMLHEDIRYSMPMVRNVACDDREKQYTDLDSEIAWFDEGKHMLAQRVKQIKTGVHWAEEPLSRISHLISNVRFLGAEENVLNFTCRFAVYRNRMTRETDWYVGKRKDALVFESGKILLLRRTIYLDHNILQPKNLSIFF